MTSRPAFSVIIPTYNRAGMVGDAVRSVLEQTFRDYEIIVVDDGSTDGTREALGPFADRIRYVHQENGGVAAARNRGIAESRGEYLAFLDSDDLFAPSMLEEALRTFERHPDAGAVFTAEIDLDAQGRQRRVSTKRTPGEFFTPAGMIGRDTRVGSGRPGIVRRKWVEQLGGFDETLGPVDSDLWIRYSFHMPMVLQPEPLVIRRWHGSHDSGNVRRDAVGWIRILEGVARDHPEFVREHPRVYRRTLAKEHMRYGRELLAEPGMRREARAALLRSIRLRPTRPKTYVYLFCSYLVPASLFRRWRSWERRHVIAEGRMSSARGA
jgi:glycosyltransferase involved in cell wall biosynthesis